MMATLALVLTSIAGVACTGRSRDEQAPVTIASADPAGSALAAPSAVPMPPRGMVYIPPGVLVAGSPEGRGPRVAENEMPGEQVVMKGFFIDELPYPNEAGAIPRANVTRAEAESLCDEQHKRLCTELEWERACKGPSNTTYAPGDRYRAADCGTGGPTMSVPPPAAMLAACRSGFGVRDLHGSVWQWTQSAWGRGKSEPLVAVRGGNGAPGEVVARCANAAPRRATDRKPDIGFRCCAGERNLAEVTLNLMRGEGLRPAPNEPALEQALNEHPPTELAAVGLPLRVSTTFRWHPVKNEEYVVQAGCAKPRAPARPVCGVAIGRSRGTGAL
jgi:sulfatase modifying factor 1